jgi:hypothetical protein
MKTAIIRFTSEHLYISELKAQYCISKITNIEWQKNDNVASWIGHVEAKIGLGEIWYKCLTREDMAYIAIPLHKMPHMSDDIKSQLQILKCQFGMNVAYEFKGTHRSLLLPKSLLNQPTEQFEHDQLWTIMACGTETDTLHFLETSSKFLEWLNTTQEDWKNNFENMVSQFHTSSVKKQIYTELFPQCLHTKVGESFEYNIPFIVQNTVEDVNVKCYRLRSVVVGILFRSEAN